MSELRLFDVDRDPSSTPGVRPGTLMDTNTHISDTRTPETRNPETSGPETRNMNTRCSPHPFTVEVVRSSRRRRTVSAQMHGTVLRISIPNWMSKKEELASVENMVKRFTRRLATDAVDLADRARMLAKAHDLRTPAVIEWSDSLKAVWGLCTPSTSHIRLSTRLVGFPRWVLDYVIVHELAHLHVPGHGPDFWKLVLRYPRTERAIGYLMAKSGDGSGDDSGDASGDSC